MSSVQNCCVLKTEERTELNFFDYIYIMALNQMYGLYELKHKEQLK